MDAKQLQEIVAAEHHLRWHARPRLDLDHMEPALPVSGPDICDIAVIIERHRDRAGALLPLLHDVQAAFGYVPDAALRSIADALNISRADLHGVVSFYHDFRTEPPERPIVRLCRAEACQARGAEALLARASARRDVDVDPVYCLGLCASGPAAMVGDRIVARLDAAAFDRLLDEVTA